MAALLEVRGLEKRYGRVQALDGVDLTVRAGTVYGFLGPNGAGKTTAIRILAGLTRPTRGEVRLAGFDLIRDRTRAATGLRALVEVPAFYTSLTGTQNLRIFARLAEAPADDVPRLLEAVGLTAAANRAVGGYSLGMRQRLGIAQAMVGRPRLVVLDEPMNGLDPAAIHLVRHLIREAASKHGVTFFLSSHLLHDVETLCDEAAILHRGKVVAEGPLSTLMGGEIEGFRFQTSNDTQALEALSLSLAHAQPRREGRGLRIDGDDQMLESLHQILNQAGAPAIDLHAVRGSLERTFMDLTQGVMG